MNTADIYYSAELVASSWTRSRQMTESSIPNLAQANFSARPRAPSK